MATPSYQVPPPPPPMYGPAVGGMQKETKLPLAGGICTLIGGIFCLISAAYYAYYLAVVTAAVGALGGLGYVGGGLTAAWAICVVMPIIFGILAILGGIMAMKSKSFGLAITGSVLGMVAGIIGGGWWIAFILCLVGLILIAVGKEGFK